MRKTKIVCTIGPASESPAVLDRLLAAGMDVARFNLSHGTQDEHRRRIRAVRDRAGRAGKFVALMLDTRGPEIRLGQFQDGGAELVDGAGVVLTPESVTGTSQLLPVNYAGLAGDVRPGSQVLIDDGNIILEVVAVRGRDVVCTVLAGGMVTDRKKVNLPGASVGLDAVSRDDVEDIVMGVEEEVHYIAASFIRKPEDMVEVRRVVERNGGNILLIAKIESREGVDNLDQILKVSDGLMVARGDLGVEIPAEEVPLLQKHMIEEANRAGKPVITATQMLESMVARPRPTRAEASDVANAILDGSDAVMLSAETATGKYPVESVQVMHRIACTTEHSLDYRAILARKAVGMARTVTDAISHATAQAALDLGARAIITATESGHTARMVAKYRPRAPVLAATPRLITACRLSLVWGAVPLLVEAAESTERLVDNAVHGALEAGLITPGDLVVITAGVPAGIPGTTNLMQVHTVGDVLLRGTGIQRSATGPVCVARTAAEAERKFRFGDILVTTMTDRDFVPFMKQAAGVIAEEGGLTSHAAIAGLNLELAVIVGAEGATGKLADGDIITIDGARGLVYRGPARVL
ncbi:MAG: pyruvate kinase [Bacillota bacterium]